MTPLAETVGIVGGVGWLGSAMARAALTTGTVAPQRLWLSGRTARRDRVADWPAVRVTDDNAELSAASDVVVLSVRPENFPALALNLTGRLVISVMAGITSASIAASTGATRVVRCLPNAAAERRGSFTPWHAAPGATAADHAAVRTLLAACGAEAEVADESDLDIFTALTGSGPAFPALFASALIDAAVARGIAPELAGAAVRQLMLAAGEELARETRGPAMIVREFADYAGTTAEGLRAMEAAGLGMAVDRGIEAAARKARELSVQSG